VRSVLAKKRTLKLKKKLYELDMLNLAKNSNRPSFDDWLVQGGSTKYFEKVKNTNV
jgi:hypothetical protein